MKQCPKCSAPATDDTFLCGCGYEFDGTEMRRESVSTSNRKRQPRILLLAGIPWLTFALVFAIGGVGDTGPAGIFFPRPSAYVAFGIGLVSSIIVGLCFCVMAIIHRSEPSYYVAAFVSLLPLVFIAVA